MESYYLDYNVSSGCRSSFLHAFRIAGFPVVHVFTHSFMVTDSSLEMKHDRSRFSAWVVRCHWEWMLSRNNWDDELFKDVSLGVTFPYMFNCLSPYLQDKYFSWSEKSFRMLLSYTWLLCFLVHALAKDAHGQERRPGENSNSNALMQFSVLDNEEGTYASRLDHSLLRRDDYSCSAASKLPSKFYMLLRCLTLFLFFRTL